MAILVTVPHSCIGALNHSMKCDRRADLTAQLLHKWLYRFGQKVLIVRGARDRGTCDLNRMEARNKTAFRQLISQWFFRNRGNGRVMDIHSFQPNTGRVGTAVGNCTLALLYHTCDTIDWRMVQFLRDVCGIDVYVGISTLGDLRAEANELGIPALTLEVNTDISRPRLEWLTYCVAEALLFCEREHASEQQLVVEKAADKF
jgi:hypothetical protein